MFYNRLPLQASFNTREHGGYPTANHRVTNWKQFLRSDDVSSLTAQDISLLKEYGLTTVIDLRSLQERDSTPYVLDKEPEIEAIHLPLGSENGAQPSMPVEDPNEQLGQFYIACLENSKETLKEIVEIMTEKEGITLFHCAAGKDRTGVLSALLLNLAEVSRADILAHYQVTYEYISKNPLITEGFKKQQAFPIELLYSKPSYMETMLNHLEENYGNAEGYFKAINVDQDTLEKLKGKLVD